MLTCLDRASIEVGVQVARNGHQNCINFGAIKQAIETFDAFRSSSACLLRDSRRTDCMTVFGVNYRDDLGAGQFQKAAEQGGSTITRSDQSDPNGFDRQG